jgi:hypothetical protein
VKFRRNNIERRREKEVPGVTVAKTEAEEK